MMQTSDLFLLLALTGLALSNPLFETDEYKRSVVSFQSLNNEPEPHLEPHPDDYINEIKEVLQLIKYLNSGVHVDLGEYGLQTNELLVSGVSKSASSLGRGELGPISVANDENSRIDPLKYEKKQRPEVSLIKALREDSKAALQNSTNDNVNAAERAARAQPFVTLTRTSTETVEEEASTIFVLEVHTMTKKSEPTLEPQNDPLARSASQQTQHAAVQQGPSQSTEYSADPISPASHSDNTHSTKLKQVADETPSSRDQKPETIDLNSISTHSLRELFKESLLDFRKEFSGIIRQNEEPNKRPSVVISSAGTTASSLVSTEPSNETSDDTFSIPQRVDSSLTLGDRFKDIDINYLKSILNDIMPPGLNPTKSSETLYGSHQSQVSAVDNEVDPGSFKNLVSNPHSSSSASLDFDKKKMTRVLGLRDEDYALLGKYYYLLSLGRFKALPKDAARDILDIVHSKDKQQGIYDLKYGTSVKDLDITRTEDIPDLQLDSQILDITSFDALEKQVNGYLLDHPNAYEQPNDFDETEINSRPLKDQEKEEGSQVQEKRVKSKIQVTTKQKKPKMEIEQELSSRSKGHASVLKRPQDPSQLEDDDFEERYNQGATLFDRSKQWESDIQEPRIVSSNDYPRANENQTNASRNSANMNGSLSLEDSGESPANLVDSNASGSSIGENARKALDSLGKIFQSNHDEMAEKKLNKKKADKPDNYDKYMTTLARGLTKKSPSSDSKASRHEFLEKVKNNPSSLFDKHGGGEQQERDSTKGFLDITSGSSHSLFSVSRSYALFSTILMASGILFL